MPPLSDYVSFDKLYGQFIPRFNFFFREVTKNNKKLGTIMEVTENSRVFRSLHRYVCMHINIPERTAWRPSTVVDSASKGMSPFTVSMTSSSLLYTRPHTFRTRSKKHATSMAMLKVSASATLTTARAAHGLPAPSSLATLVLENILTNFSIYNNC